MPELIAPVGPLFGPNFVEVVIKDEGVNEGDAQRLRRSEYSLQVFPDALNPQLKSAGLPTQYYYQPARVYLAHRQNSDDYAFGLFIYKGLLSRESVLGVGDQPGDVETGGGWCTFTTTFAVPDWVLSKASERIKSREFGISEGVDSNAVEKYFNFDAGANMPDPRLGAIPILNSTTSLSVPTLPEQTADPAKPNPARLIFHAQGAGKGSIEAHGYNTFHVTCNQLAAGALAGSIKGGKSPFAVYNELEEQFYANETTIRVTVDVDKVFSAFSAAISAGGFLGIDSLSASAAYEQCTTNGGISTTIVKGDVSEEMQKWIGEQAHDMRIAAMNLVKSEIFDWKPPSPTEATASNDRGWFSNLFGGAIVSLKANYEKKEVKFNQELTVVGPVKRTHTVSGDLGDLAGAFATNPDAYFTVADIAEWFRKVQIAASCNVFARPNVPVASVSLAALYPNYNAPELNGRPNFETRKEGEHYTLGSAAGGDTRTHGVARWTKDNPDDIVNLAFLRLDPGVSAWQPNAVKLRKTVAFVGGDERVDMKAGLVFETEWVTETHNPELGLTEIGYTTINFSLMPRISDDSRVCLVQVEFGAHRDSFELNKTNGGVFLWELYSDKYFDVTELTYAVEFISVVEGKVIQVKGQPGRVPLSPGAFKSADVLLVAP